MGFRLQSLRFKVAAAVVVVLAVAMGLVFVVQYHAFRRELIERLGLSSTPLSDVIKGSLHHAMQTRDLSELAAIVDNVSRQPGVIKVFVLNKSGEIRFSPVPSDIGKKIPLSDETCQVCHRVRADQRTRTVIFTAASGEHVFRNVSPIRNEPACFGCHGTNSAVNGVLISDFSMAQVESQLSAKLRQMLLALLLAIAAAGGAITLMMNRLVVSKLERFAHAARLLGKGTLDLRVDVDAGDEIGQLASSFNDMVEGLRRARELRQRKELLESVLDKVHDGVAVFDADGVLLAFNHGSEVAFRARAVDVVGTRHAILGELHAPMLAEARSGGAITRETKLVRADGTYFPAVVHVVPLRSERDELLAWVVVVRDLTAERVRERLQAQLGRAEKLAAVGRLAAGVAHELNNPLGNVLLYSKLLLEGLPAADARHANARHIVDNTLRCKGIVRGLLDYAKESDVRMTWADVNEVVERSVSLVAGELDRRQIRHELRLAKGLPKVRCDRGQIEQVLVNLLQNGIEAVDSGSGRMAVFTAEAPEGDGLVLGVEDNGHGIPADSVAKLFEPFYTTKANGTGLGLAVSYGIVERHGGSIWVQSRVDGEEHGTTFFVKLPLVATGVKA